MTTADVDMLPVTPLKLPRVTAVSTVALNSGRPLARVLDRLAAANAAAAAEAAAVHAAVASAAARPSARDAAAGAAAGGRWYGPAAACGGPAAPALPAWMTVSLGRPLPPLLPAYTLQPAGLSWRAPPARGGGWPARARRAGGRPRGSRRSSPTGSARARRPPTRAGGRAPRRRRRHRRRRPSSFWRPAGEEGEVRHATPLLARALGAGAAVCDLPPHGGSFGRTAGLRSPRTR